MSLGMGSPDNMVFPENVIKIFCIRSAAQRGCKNIFHNVYHTLKKKL
ncbi:hypothetical protein NMH_1525 [Neisseria meningitidis H44/76]|uniref:Uncharacterized protein n=4 Tax=Neisseria meningitidis TaxID=487 RepID=A0A0H5QTD7_NEIMI|nr:hypothetical protein NMH_1525 [Neisseria meningitidis H44/76]CBA09848.1 hypothetical protein predicted by Glimmer/Critica [Neisseria meningitidis alpha275]CCA45379.1 hypothetical protein NMALPHA522_1838 [Neisseria meningitidis alpha522]CRY98923.1 hypothetical protein [Neisseria meningitidis serogroup B]